MVKIETIEEYLARGGTVTVCPPRVRPDYEPDDGDVERGGHIGSLPVAFNGYALLGYGCYWVPTRKAHL